jgi:Flp pilus assembly protein TadG
MFNLDLLRKSWRTLCGNQRGNIAILFAATAIPLLLVMGGAIDVARFARYKADLANTVDAAALALGRQGQDYTEAQATTFVEDYVAALQVGDDRFSIEGFDVDKTDNGYIVSAAGSMQTVFLPLGSMAKKGGAIMKMDMNIVAEVVHSSNRLEVALVLDVTGSMNCGNTLSSSCTGNWSNPGSSSRIVALRSAANILVNMLMTQDMTDPNMVKIGVVPFEGTVNIGSTYAANPPWWVDWNNQAQAYWNGRNFGKYNFSTGSACTTGLSCKYVGHKWLFDQLAQANSSMSWAGCVEMRREPHDNLDTTPDTAQPDTLFVPFFWPDEPDRYATNQYKTSPADTRYNNNYSSSNSSWYNYTYHNNYLNDKISPSAGSSRPANAQLHPLKYKYTNSSNKADWHSDQFSDATSFPYSAGPNRGCPQAIVPLTNQKSSITGLLNNLIAYPAMGTFIPNGLVWGWHIVTPNEPFTQGVAPGDEYYDKTVKAIVLFTDGDNSVTGASNHNSSYFSGYNYVSQDRLGTTSSASTATDDLDAKTAALCANVKNDGPENQKIRLYTVTFGSLSSSSLNLMRNCATVDKGQPLHYHAPSTSELEDIFRQIGEDLSEIHLAM